MIMKKMMMMAACAVSMFTMLAMMSCGSSKVTAPSREDSMIGQAAGLDPVMEYAEQNPAVREFGTAQHFKEATAKNLATGQARSAYASSIRSAIIAACEDIGLSLDKYAGDDESSKSVSDQSGEANDFMQSITAEIVENTHPVKYSRYMLPNKQWKYYVCIEYMGTPEEQAEKVEDKLKEKISQSDRTKLEERHDRFRQRIMQQLNQ